MFQLLKKIFSLSFLYGVSSISYQLVGLVLLPVYTRFLTPTEFGIYTVALIGIVFFGVFVNFGIPAAFFRFFYDYKDDQKRSEMISTTFLFVTFSSALMIILVLCFQSKLKPVFFNSEEYYSCFYLTIFLSLLESPQLLEFHYFRASGQVKKYCIFSFLRSGALFAGALFCLTYLKLGIYGLFLARIASTLPTYLYLALFVGQISRF